MLFKQVHLDRIKNGSITLAFRKWNKPSVNAGSLIKTAIGLVRIKTVDLISEDSLTESDAVEAGFSDLKSLFKMLNSRDGLLYRIGVEYHSEDPRIALRQVTKIPVHELESISKALQKFDRYSKSGPWTTHILKAIHDHPKLKAADLAVIVGKQKEWLKLNVRKLKELGLTISFEPGYMISPRGEEVIKRILNQ